MSTKKYISIIVGLAMVSSLALALTVFAQNNQPGAQGGRFGKGMMNPGQKPAIVGTVSAVDTTGNTITISGRQGFNPTTATKTTATTYTVDVTNTTKIIKSGVTSPSISDIAVGDTVVVQGTVSSTNVITATSVRDGQINQGRMDNNKMMPSVVGKVSAVTGSILTVVSNHGFNKTASTTTFTVDATNAKILRGQTAITISDIAVGDTIIVQGTVTGTTVVATTISDGKVGDGNRGDNNQALLQIQGNGQPVVAGTISAINASILTITNNSNVTYTVDATSAKIVQGKNTITLSGVKTGDSVIVQGTVNVTSVTASTIIDQAKPASTTVGQQAHTGIFDSIGQFFKHLFGF